MAKTFKTKAGTLIPILDLRGKDYLQVPWRVVWMREEHPEWRIKTSLEMDSDRKGCIATAEILNEQGHVMATAHKYEDQKGFQDFIEKSETGAIGRALALCGYGTQFAPELIEGDERLVDAPLDKKGPPVSLVTPPLPKVKNYEPPPYGEPTNEPSPFDDDEPTVIVKTQTAIPYTGDSPQDKEMTIGKHTGKKFSEILSGHMDYITWCKEQTKTQTRPNQIMKDLISFATYHGAFNK